MVTWIPKLRVPVGHVDGVGHQGDAVTGGDSGDAQVLVGGYGGRGHRKGRWCFGLNGSAGGGESFGGDNCRTGGPGAHVNELPVVVVGGRTRLGNVRDVIDGQDRDRVAQGVEEVDYVVRRIGGTGGEGHRVVVNVAGNVGLKSGAHLGISFV